MALFQISEPGEAPEPHARKRAVGIDLGTTNSLVATVRHGLAVVLPDLDGRPLVPSIVRYAEQGVETGYTAMEHQSADPQNTIVSVKRMMGRGLDDLADARRFPYRFVDGPGMVRIATRAGVKSPVEVSADLLRALRERAEQSLGGPVDAAVVTVPAYFDDAQRQATKDAAQLAGLPVLRLLNEPTAAAIAYGLDNASEGVYAVYDLGGGTFDISILRLSKGVFEVLATNGDSALGGDDFDHRVFCWIIEAAKLPPLAPADARLLLVKAREAKENLSDHDSAAVLATLSGGLAINLTLTKAIFTEITANLVAKTMQPVKRALRDASLAPSAVKGVVLVGGATRMPQIRRAVAEYLRPAAADQSQSGRSGRARRGDPGQQARRQPRAQRRVAAARRHPAVARARNDGRPDREDHPAQRDDSDRARAGVHHLQGRPDGDGDPRRAGRAREWSWTAARWRASNCAASRRWSPARRASA